MDRRREQGLVIAHEIKLNFKEVDVTVIRGNVKVENAAPPR